MVQVYVEDCYKWSVGTHDTFFCLISSTMSKMVSQSGSLRSELVALSNGTQHTAGCRGSNYTVPGGSQGSHGATN